MNIPTFTIFDADKKEESGSNKTAHEKDNKILFGLLGISSAAMFPEKDLWGDSYIVWSENITEVIKNEIPKDKYEGYKNKSNLLYDNIGQLQKNPLCIALILKQAIDDGIKLQSLDKLCDVILK